MSDDAPAGPRRRRVMIPDDPTVLSHLLAGILQVESPRRQALLEAATSEERLRGLLALIDRETLLLQRRLRLLPARCPGQRRPPELARWRPRPRRAAWRDPRVPPDPAPSSSVQPRGGRLPAPFRARRPVPASLAARTVAVSCPSRLPTHADGDPTAWKPPCRAPSSPPRPPPRPPSVPRSARTRRRLRRLALRLRRPARRRALRVGPRGPQHPLRPSPDAHRAGGRRRGCRADGRLRRRDRASSSPSGAVVTASPATARPTVASCSTCRR